jgi:hypothetical protein
MNLTMLSNDTTATFEVGSDEFALSSAASSGRVIGRALTERLNRALALGYMPALRKTTIR